MFEKGKHYLSKKQYLRCYENMLLARRFEERCGQLYGMGMIGGFCHLYIGQEAVVSGFYETKQSGDSEITSYRDHVHAILSGIHPKHVMAELTGRADGCSKGKGGSMHMFNAARKFYGGHGIVGAQVPIGTGLAFAEKYNGTKNICYTYLGDGASNQGQVFEAFNMASLWQLPVIYIIENNEYSMGTSVERCSAVTELYRKGESFNIPGVVVNGMNLDEVYNIGMQAAEYVRGGKGSIIVEAKTYRYKGHSVSDPAKYRSKEEVEEYKAKDPIREVRDTILKKSYATEDQLKTIEKKVKDTLSEVVEFATNASLPNEDELYTDIYK